MESSIIFYRLKENKQTNINTQIIKPRVLSYHCKILKKFYGASIINPFASSDKVVVKKINAKRFIAIEKVRKPKFRKKFLENPETIFMQNENLSAYKLPKEFLPSIKIKNSSKHSLKSSLIELFDGFNTNAYLALAINKFLPKKIVAYCFGISMVSISITACGGNDSPPPTPPNPPTPIENLAPTARGNVNKSYGEINDTFVFNAYDSSDPEGKPMTYTVDVDGDGTYDTPYTSTKTNTNYIYLNGGNMNPKIQVKDDKGLTDTYNLGKVGILDPANNPITIDFQVPKYVVALTNIKATSVSEDVNNRPLVYSFDWGIGYGNVVDSNNNQASKTYSDNDVGKKTLRNIVMNDYQIQNETTKEIEIGSSIPYITIVHDKIDGKEYKVNMMDDGNFWIVQNFAGKIGEADWYESDSLNNSVFGRYYNASEIDQIGDRIMVAPDGSEHVFKVATTNEWDALFNSYNQTTGPLKYKEFANGENVGATNDSGLSLMLGGYRAPDGTNEEFENMGNLGYFYAAVETSNARMVIIKKDNTNMPRGLPPETLRATTRLIKNNQN